ncbi:helix-turn-helix transcriptional regulator [Streptomyces bathyalis]|uniref:Helix-turn-helix transcriptional regulator n=1 Tax=Streptomyces bathyalis TaxID=2710756 RepID=A0A7T1WRW4_9ACTN|nr:LuxR C-terminal-related transcriptional regulator [Streptomyces bathyalis]QPP06582.1 helix-turn-helix transcriptional regulator [Streptomyces bathyalis]
MCEQAWERQLTCAPAGDQARPALVLVEGSAGTGKSELVRRLLESPGARAVPRLAVTFGPSGAADIVDPAACVSHPSLESSLASVRPVLLVAEDLHHAGEEALVLLRGLLRDPPARLMAVLTYRPEQLARTGLPLGRAVDYPARLSVTRYVPPPLEEQQVRTLAGELLGAQRCTEGFVTRLHQRSAGVPQVVVDLLSMLRDACGAGERQHFTAGDVDEAGVPVRLRELVLERLDSLPEACRPVVRAAAVLGEPAGAGDLATVAGLWGDAGHEALVAALETSVLRETEQGRYGFAVPMEASAVYEELHGPVRERLHERAAAMLVGRTPVPWTEVAHHWRGGGRTQDWLRAAEQVAAAGSEGDHDGAVTEDEARFALLEQVLGARDLPPDRRGRLALTLARGAMLGPRSEGTARALRRIVEDPALPAAARGEIRLELGLLLHSQKRRFGEGRAELRLAAEELRGRPALAARASAALANPFFPGPALDEGLDWLRRAEAAAAASGDRAARTAVAACRATVLMNSGDPEAWRLVQELPRNSPERTGRQQVARGLCNTANGAVYLGHYRRAGELLAEGVELAVRSGAPFLERVGRGTALFRDWLTGRWDGLAERCTVLVAEDGVANDARVVLALLALAKGEWAAAQDWLPRPGSSSSPHREHGEPWNPCEPEQAWESCEAPVAATAAGACIRLHLARQDVDAAQRAAGSAWTWLRTKGVWVWGAGLAPWVVEAHTRAGAPAAARAAAEEFAEGLAGRDAPAASAALLWCRALLAEAAGEAEEAFGRFEEAAAAYARLPNPYASALMTESAGRCAFVLGSDPEAAARRLSACVERLTALGAVWDAARVRATLRAHDPAAARRRSPGRPSYAERMSPREGEVAELAATGLTNREIAATLHLSPRTVEQHVARAMRKLGISSRQALAERAASAGRT